jgi:hypothetical protein
MKTVVAADTAGGDHPGTTPRTRARDKTSVANRRLDEEVEANIGRAFSWARGERSWPETTSVPPAM